MKAELLDRATAMEVVVANHYLHRFPTGWTRSFRVGDVFIVYSIPANNNLEKFLFTRPVGLRELARLWAPDGHHDTALTQAISLSAKALREDSTEVQALVSFADPNVGHHGGIYQAASWTYTGQSSESRGYLAPDGRIVARRSFHSGSTSLVPDLPVVKMKGKLRYVKTMNRYAKVSLKQSSRPYPKGDPNG